MWRWLRRLMIALVVLLALAAISIQIILNTDIPRTLIVEQLRDQTGLDVQLEGFATGWSGRSEVKGLRLSLPGESEALVSVESASIEHAGLIRLAVFGDPRLAVVDADGIRVEAKQAETGQWNFQQAVSLLADASVASADEERIDPLRTLEGIVLRDLAIEIRDRKGREVLLDDLTLEGKTVGPSTLAIELSGAEALTASGRVVVRGDWSHTLQCKVIDAHPLLSQWLAELPKPVSGAVRWRGWLAEGRLRGRIETERIVVGANQLAGAAAVTAGSVIEIEPDGIRLDVAGEPARRLHIGDGAIVLAGDGVTWRRLVVSVAGLTTEIDGRYGWQDGEGELAGSWTGQRVDWNLAHSGSLEGHLSRGISGIDAKMNLTTTGRRKSVRWQGDVTVSATGSQWQSLTVSASVKRGSLEVASPTASESTLSIPLEGLALTAAIDWPQVDVRELSHRLGGTVEAVGGWNMTSKRWQAELRGDGVRIEGLTDRAFDFRGELEGNDQRIAISNLSGNSGQFRWRADNGEINLNAARGFPASFELNASWWSPQLEGDAVFDQLPPANAGTSESAAAVNAEPANNSAVAPTLTPATGGSDDPAWSAAARFTGRAEGKLFPLELTANGSVTTRQLRVKRRPIELIDIPVAVHLDDHRAEVHSQPFDLLGGEANLDATVRWSDRTVRANAHLEQIGLAELLRVAAPELQMAGGTSSNLTLVLPEADPSRLVVEGDFSVEQFEHGETRFEKLTGKLRTRLAGRIELRPIRIVNGDARADGRITVDLREGAKADAKLTLKQWPVKFAVAKRPCSATVDGVVTLDTNLIARTIAGSFDAQADIQIEESRLGVFSGSGSWNQKHVELELAESLLLDARVNGKASIDLSDLTASKGRLTWQGLAPERLSRWFGEAAALSGATMGTIDFGPASDATAPESFRIGVAIDPMDELAYRKIQIDSVKATVFAGNRRVVLDELNIDAADGEISCWAALRQRSDGWYEHVQVRAESLDLDQLRVAWADDDGKPIPGRVSGTANFFGRADRWSDYTGEGRLTLTESNLANTNIIGAVFARLNKAPTEPKGSGFIDLRMQGGRLIIPRLIYRNGASEVLLRGTIQDLSKGWDSPVTGQAVGTIRPLREVALPFFDDADRLLRAVQTGATTFRIEGTVREHQAKPASIANLGAWVERMLSDD